MIIPYTFQFFSSSGECLFERDVSTEWDWEDGPILSGIIADGLYLPENSLAAEAITSSITDAFREHVRDKFLEEFDAGRDSVDPR